MKNEKQKESKIMVVQLNNNSNIMRNLKIKE
jgi:hypothetical protein